MRHQPKTKNEKKGGKGGGGTCNVDPGATKWAQRGQPRKKKNTHTQNNNTNIY